MFEFDSYDPKPDPVIAPTLKLPDLDELPVAYERAIHELMEHVHRSLHDRDLWDYESTEDALISAMAVLTGNPDYAPELRATIAQEIADNEEEEDGETE